MFEQNVSFMKGKIEIIFLLSKNDHVECKNEAGKWRDYKNNQAVAKPYLYLYFRDKVMMKY